MLFYFPIIYFKGEKKNGKVFKFFYEVILGFSEKRLGKGF